MRSARFRVSPLVSAFAKEPSWLNLLFVVIAVIEVVMSVMGVIAAVKNLIASIAKVGAKAFVSTSDDIARAGKAVCNGEQKPIGGNCFKEGTKVLTKDGYKNIEDIQVGDEVLSYDEQTGLQDYKKVVHLFRGETKEWHHIFVNGEEIVCTGEHPFFVDGKGFVEAKYLTKEDSLVLSNGSIVKIDKIEREKLLKSQTKYNFEVEDFHTYYVTEKDVLVHNQCAKAYLDEALERRCLDSIPEGGFKESWIENGYKIEVRAHVGNQKFTDAKMIYRVSRQKVVPNGVIGTGVEYLGSDNIWYHVSQLKPTSSLYNPFAAMITHMPL